MILKRVYQKLITLFTIPRKISDKSNFELFRDLKNEIPEVMKIMEKYEISINNMILALYSEGQEAGYLRKDIDPVLILRFGRTFKDKFDMSDFEGIGNYTKYDLFKSFHKLFIQGVLSKKALAQNYEEIELLLEEV